MSDAKTYYHRLGMADARKKVYPLYTVLLLAGENVEAGAYRRGWEEVTGQSLVHWRDGVKF
jgi:hypothetical protein